MNLLNSALMKLIKKISLFVALFLIVATLGVKASANTTVSVTNTSLLYVHISTVYYADLENSGSQNDIYAEIFVSFDSPYCYNHLYMYLELDLPSGAYYYYVISMEFYGVYQTTLSVFLYNHATESGDYILYSAIYFADSPGVQRAESASLFDPPGHTDDADPPRIEVSSN